jgi:hypothetical protein
MREVLFNKEEDEPRFCVACANQLTRVQMIVVLKFIYSEKAPKFCEIFTIELSYVVPVKSTVEILQIFVAFSEYMNFGIVLI